MKYAMLFEDIRSLKGRKIVLKPLDLTMAQDLFNAIEESREELFRWLSWDCKHIGDAIDIIDKNTDAIKTGSSIAFAIYMRSPMNTFAGVIELSQLNPYTPRASVALWVRTSLTNQGVATDALSTLITYCKNEANLVRLDSTASVDNVQGQKVLQKCGFQQEGLKRKGERCHGVWNDIYLMGVIIS